MNDLFVLCRYVVEKDVKNNVVFVSRNYYSLDKRRRTFRVGSLNWFGNFGPTNNEQLKCKVPEYTVAWECSILSHFISRCRLNLKLSLAASLHIFAK
jgi:tRNA U34 2-thiouridine synthase MnmA/TrmU